MLFKFPNIPTNFQFGLGLTILNPAQKHVAIIYSDSDDQLKICHLAWHKDLRNEPFYNPNYIVSDIDLDEVNLKYLSATAETVSLINTVSVPYGFRSPLVPYNTDFKYVGSAAGEGMTCATFVLSIFEHHGFFVLEKASWQQTPEDTIWQSEIIRTLSQYVKDPIHLVNMKHMIGNVVRFRPEQVFSTATVEPKHWPIQFNDAELLAEGLLEHISQLQ